MKNNKDTPYVFITIIKHCLIYFVYVLCEYSEGRKVYLVCVA